MKKLFSAASLCITFLAPISASAYDVVCVGSPCLDILLQVDEATLKTITTEKGGSRPVDYLTLLNIINRSKAKPSRSLGGSGTNVVRALAHLGDDCALVGKVGSDEAEAICRDLKKIKIDPLLLQSGTPTTRVCCLVTPDGQRTMRVFLGAGAEELSVDDIRFNCLENAKLVHLEGYLLYVRDGEFVKKITQKARACGAKISLDCASYEVVARYKNLILQLLENHQIDILFANEDEVQILTGFNPQHACRELQKRCEIAVITVGARGCWVGSGNTIFHSPALPARVVDTTGAGDFFTAGFLHGYLQGKELEACARQGNSLGKAAVEVFGTTLSQTTWRRLKSEAT